MGEASCTPDEQPAFDHRFGRRAPWAAIRNEKANRIVNEHAIELRGSASIRTIVR